MKPQYYYIIQELEEGLPDYDFVVKADNYMEAHEIATKVITTDYPDYEINYSCHQVTAKQLLERLTIN